MRKPTKQRFLVLLVIIFILLMAMSILIGNNDVSQGTISAVISSFLFAILWWYIIEYNRENENYLERMSYRIDVAGHRILHQFPVGVLLLDDQNTIEWTNEYFSSYSDDDKLMGLPINDFNEDIALALEQNQDFKSEFMLFNRLFHVEWRQEHRVMYFFDITDKTSAVKHAKEIRPVIASILLDNYDDITETLDDQARSNLSSNIIEMLNTWAKTYNLYLRRIASDRFIAFLNARTLKKLEENKFTILDEIRDLKKTSVGQITLSIGIAEGTDSLTALGELAQSGLDLALGRGGDQIAIKNIDGSVRFIGGKTNPIEKRTRVRARVVSHALQEILKDMQRVIIMGHKNPDVDAIGAAIGMSRFARMNKLEAYIVLDEQDIDDTLARVMKLAYQQHDLQSIIVTREQAWELMTPDSVLVVVDTSAPSRVLDISLLHKASHTVVIDHHRRGEEIITQPLLAYIEPYASSSAELITELLEYQPQNKQLTDIEANIMLAGMVVDTKQFTLRTGSRTFDAAAYLRQHGADPIVVQNLLKENLKTTLRRNRILESANFYRPNIIIAQGLEDEVYDPVLLAQAADTLLNMSEVSVAFVVAYRTEETVGISARSLGDFNVQLTMEKLGGGGHLTNAATLIKDKTIKEVCDMLELAINQQLGEGI